MKRLRCPECDEPILFDETRFEPGRALVFECPACNKRFKVKLKPKNQSETPDEAEAKPQGWLVVVENAFHLKQVIPLYEGENVVGRHVKGTKANAAFKTVDPSVDTTHCIITVKTDRQTGRPQFVLRDAPSGTGTFLMNTLLPDRAREIVDEGAIITIGATTMILRTEQPESDD
ncbi:MAG: FHA domain-containing protein [Alloprevotella sp.]|nr:FHA domain-containing protein [Alloprevotella sp.]MDY4567781.1 FHA domain-containing protein [Alloprevotella sp.]